MKILITGLKQSGKSTFANELEKYGFKHLQFSKELKDMAEKIMPLIFKDLSIVNGFVFDKDMNKVCVVNWEDNNFKNTIIPSPKFNKNNITFREFLQNFGTDFVRKFINNDYWKDNLYYTINKCDNISDFVVSDLRFINEIEEDTIVIGVDRGFKLGKNDHASELEIPEIIKNYADYPIDSDCSLEEYKKRINILIKKILTIHKS